MNWKTWSIQDWNSALIQKVFLGHGRAGSSIKRIDANARFLIACTEDKSADSEDVKKSFLMCFGSSPKRVRALYNWNTTSPQNYGGNFPKIFAPLYLTLMAGSADDNTHEFGRFRDRFKELLSPYVKNSDSLLSMPFSDLPVMWKHMADWSKQRNERFGDCGELILPSVHTNENRIGLSKRIAFPTYKDETNLKQLLEAKQLSENSEFTEVIKAIRYRLSTFSSDFIFEFEYFANCVRSQEFLKAHESRFWGVVQDLTLESEIAITSSKYKFCLQLDVSDPFEPMPYLFFDEVGKELISSCLDSLIVQRRDGLNFVGYTNQNYPDLQIIINSINSAEADKSKVGRTLHAGWVTLLPDQFGNLSTDGSYSNNGPVCFFVKDEFIAVLRQNLDSLGVQFVAIRTGKATKGWSGFTCKTINRKALKSVLSIAPFGLSRFLRLGWAPPRIQLRGGAWQGQTLLLNPASNPIVSLEDAVSGTFKLLNNDGEAITEDFALMKMEDGFCAYPTSLIDTKNAAFCEYALTSQSGLVKYLRVILTQSLPSMIPRVTGNFNRWFFEGSFGTQQPLSSTGLESIPFRNNSLIFKANNLKPTFSQCNSINVEKIPYLNIEFSKILNWISDALLLRFETRESLPFKLLLEHLEGPALLANISPKYLRRLLIDGQWITPLYKIGAPQPNVVAAPRLAFTTQENDKFIVRISGMLSVTNFLAVEKFLINEESIKSREDGYASLDCMEIRLNSFQRIIQACEILNAQLVSQEDFPNPISALDPQVSKMANFAPPYQSKNMQKWIRENKSWESQINAGIEWPTGEVRGLSNEASRKNWYWIRISNDQYIRTDSLVWSTLASEVAAQKPIFELSEDGSLVWSEFLVGIPISLSRWWLLFEGGSVCLSKKYQTIFNNGSSKNYLKILGIEINQKEKKIFVDFGKKHRNLALKKYQEKKKKRLQLVHEI